MKALNISDVRNRLPAVIEDVATSSEPLVVTRYGKPIASIVPFRDTKSPEGRYPLRGKPITVAADFDESMPALWAALGVEDKSGVYVMRQPRKSRTRKTGGRQ
jgi:prevent-host-death family protein